LTKYVFKNLPKLEDEPLFSRDYNLCISCLRCVRACRDLRGVETLGFVYHKGKVMVGPTKSAVYADSDCRFCGACVEVCPTGAITDKDLPPGERTKALVPCISNCPVEIDIPHYMKLIAEGKHSEALTVVTERMPFPTILGYICFHPCEDACRRRELSGAMAICALKRFVAENAHAPARPIACEPTGKKVAVVGSGPAGLAAAYYLARAGHGVTVFEARNEIGGMLRYAVPDYRLPPEILEENFKVLTEMGIEFRTNCAIGKDRSLSELRKDFDAVFIATGATLSKKISIEGSDVEGIMWGLDFLRDVKEKKVKSVSSRVLVIGGGNVAIDVARSAIRLGASEVQLACLECAEEMPAHDWEIDEAKEEGVVINPSWGPNRIIGEDRVHSIELVSCTSVFDCQGNFAPTFDECTLITKETDSVILAIGQTSDTSFIEGLDIQRGIISVNDEMKTSGSGVYAGGEIAQGPSSVVEAISDGAKAASAIDRYLGGSGKIYSITEPKEKDPYLGATKDFASLARFDIPKRSVAERQRTFGVVELGYDEDQAKREAARCLRCDLRLLIEPVILPPEKWLELNVDNVESVPDTEGVYQILDEEKLVISIKGTMNLRQDLSGLLTSPGKARYFSFEEDPMYTKRESELIQQFIQQHGRMPEGGEDDLDDLF
jgi:NADPH-dependent glutamate synthase beta subunit-like oxidoreductase/Pyruvate/2-oxoacid:ferredoxin oxidoreductase delta subunit